MISKRSSKKFPHIQVLVTSKTSDAGYFVLVCHYCQDLRCPFRPIYFLSQKSVFMHEIFSSCKALYLKTANLN